MTDKKNIESVKFLFELNSCADNEEKLVQLAGEAVVKSHDKRTFVERKNQDLSVNPASINLGAAIAKSHALMNHNLSTNDKLYMIMHKYLNAVLQKNPKASKDKALERFCADFAAKFPKEYGVKQNIQPALNVNTVMALRQHGRG